MTRLSVAQQDFFIDNGRQAALARNSGEEGQAKGLSRAYQQTLETMKDPEQRSQASKIRAFFYILNRDL